MPEPREVSVENGDERPHEVTITLDEDEERLVEETLSLDSPEEWAVEATDALGGYDLCAETDEHGRECIEFGNGDAYGDGTVTVDGAEVFVSQAVAETEPCPWDRRWD